MKTLLASIVLSGLTALPIHAAPLCDNLGFAGLLAKCNRGETIKVTLASGKPLGEDVTLQSGAYYKLEITADGSAEIGIEGADFFRAIWINEIVISGIEVRPMAVSSLEFDDAGTAEMSFIAIKPGRHVLRIPDSEGESQRITITIQ